MLLSRWCTGGWMNRASASSARSARSRRLGAATVEFACVAPLLFSLVLGMIEFGRVMMVQESLTNAAREGARTAVLPGRTTSDAQTAVSNCLTNAGISGANPATVTPDPSTANPGDAITVTASVPFSQVTWLPGTLFMKNVTLSASAVMRKEFDTR